MTITEALKISRTIRRSSWGREDYLLHFKLGIAEVFPSPLPNNPAFPKSNVYILDNDYLGFDGLTATDWVALIPCDRPTDLRIGDCFYRRLY